jgi:hypothetical protein
VTTWFLIYALFLVGSGIAMLAIACVRGGQSTTRRIWSGVLGGGFALYGLYLLAFFRGGHYVIFYYAFILPFLVIVRFFRDRSTIQARQQAAAFRGQVPGYGQAPTFGQAPYGQAPTFGQAPGSDQVPYGQAPGFGQAPYGQVPGSGQVPYGQAPGSGPMPSDGQPPAPGQ